MGEKRPLQWLYKAHTKSYARGDVSLNLLQVNGRLSCSPPKAVELDDYFDCHSQGAGDLSRKKTGTGPDLGQSAPALQLPGEVDDWDETDDKS